MSIAKRLFETAVEDLKAVEVLYNSRHYNLAVFQLQQSVEKFVKSFGIYTNAIKPEDMGKTINHLPHKVFTKLFENQISELSKRREKPIFIADLIPPHLRDNNDVKDKLDDIKGLYSEVKKAETRRHEILLLEELQQFINGAETLDDEPSFDEEKLLEDLKIDFVKTNEHFIDYFKDNENVKSISEELIKNSHEIAQNKLAEYKLDQIRSKKFNYISYVWINLSFITSTHQQSTRYPSAINEDTPNTLYDENNVIIQNMPDLIKIMKKTVEKFKAVYPNT